MQCLYSIHYVNPKTWLECLLLQPRCIYVANDDYVYNFKKLGDVCIKTGYCFSLNEIFFKECKLFTE